jgi:hypothetical protein
VIFEEHVMTEESKQSPKISSIAQEQAFFQSESEAEAQSEIMDEELWEESAKDHVIPPKLLPVLPILMIAACVLVLKFFYTEFLYAISSHSPIQLGSLSDGCDESFYQQIQHNRLVSLYNVIAQPNLTAKARVQFSERFYVASLGCDILVSLSTERYQEFMGLHAPKKSQETLSPQSTKIHKLRILTHTIVPPDLPFVVTGRAIHAARTPSLESLRSFYSVTEGMRFSQRTHIIHDGDTPSSQYWVIIGYILIYLLIMYNIWRFIAAIRRYWLTQS